MVRSSAVIYLSAALGLGVAAFGQTADSAANPGAANPVLAPAAPPPAPPPAPPDPNRAISPTVAAMLSVTMPKYDPPKPAPLPPPVDPTADLRDTDKPKNGIVRLPQYMVHEARPSVFREWDLYSKEGLAQMALLRYRGLSLVPFANMNKGVATQMYLDNERLFNMADLETTARSMQSGGDKSEANYIRSISQDTYMRGIDWGGTVPTNDLPTDRH
jgi:hypothetical protein